MHTFASLTVDNLYSSSGGRPKSTASGRNQTGNVDNTTPESNHVGVMENAMSQVCTCFLLIG
jgi:hypothetical protein